VRRVVAGRVAAAIAACAVAAAGAGCGAPAVPDPVFERIRTVTDDPDAVRAIAAMLSAYGGLDTWAARRNAEYRFSLALYAGGATPQRTTLQVHRLALGPDVHLEMEDLAPAPERVVRIDGDVVVVGGDGAGDEAGDTEFTRAYGRAIRWDFRLPWCLLDPGTIVMTRGVRTPVAAGPVPPGPCDVLRLRLDTGSPGSGSDDWQDLYISRRSHLLELVHSYRAGPNDFRLSVLADHRDFDGIRIATRRETHASDAAAAVGRLEAVAEYTDVRFDVPWESAPEPDPGE